MASSRRRRRLTGVGLRHGAASCLVTWAVMLLGRETFPYDWVAGAVLLPVGLYWYIALVIRQKKEN